MVELPKEMPRAVLRLLPNPGSLEINSLPAGAFAWTAYGIRAPRTRILTQLNLILRVTLRNIREILPPL